MEISIYNYGPANNKITAIKAIRAVTGYGLREAKELIDIVGTGVPQVLENIDEAKAQVLRNAGISFNITSRTETELKIADIADIIDGLKESVPRLLDLKAYKAAQYLIDAIEELEYEEY